MQEITSLIAELRKFSSDVADLGGPVAPQMVAQFEIDNNLLLPDDYKLVISQINGFNIMGSEVYGVRGKHMPLSLEAVHQREHLHVNYPQPSYLVPFSDDGGGNFYCFDTRYQNANKQSNPVVFWVSNYQYIEEDAPEITYNSFIQFVNKVIIAWPLEDYDYDGSRRDSRLRRLILGTENHL